MTELVAAAVNHPPHCAFCWRSGAAHPCADCLSVHYCDEECRLTGWNDHADACQRAARRCDHCDRSGARMKCSRCLAARYCDTHCQGADWPGHRETCRAPAPASPRSPEGHPAVPRRVLNPAASPFVPSGRRSSRGDSLD